MPKDWNWSRRMQPNGDSDTDRGTDGDAVTLTGQDGPVTPPQIAVAVGVLGCWAADVAARIDTRLQARTVRKEFMSLLRGARVS